MTAKGNINPNFDNARNGAGEVPCGQGRFGTMTPARGIGAKMVNNLDGVVKNAKRQYAEDRKAAARERAAEREANAFADLDTLLDDIRG